MYRIAFIIPWIGKLPPHFPVWLKTCSFNPTVDFLIFTDDTTDYPYPSNVKVHYLEFDELQAMFQKNFLFAISLNKPYKLCDFKPAYGEIFSDYLIGYDFWGHCDIDIFWGNIRKFVTFDVLKNYNRIYSHGHCCLYRNNKDINAWYRTLPHGPFQNYQDVFTSNESCCFDEWGAHRGGGMSLICQANNIPFYNEPDFADLNIRKGYFSFISHNKYTKKSKCIFSCSPDGLFVVENNHPVEEILYVHFQKRALKITSQLSEHFYLSPPLYVTSHLPNRRHPIEEITYELAWVTKKVISKIKKNIR